MKETRDAIQADSHVPSWDIWREKHHSPDVRYCPCSCMALTNAGVIDHHIIQLSGLQKGNNQLNQWYLVGDIASRCTVPFSNWQPALAFKQNHELAYTSSLFLLLYELLNYTILAFIWEKSQWCKMANEKHIEIAIWYCLIPAHAPKCQIFQSSHTAVIQHNLMYHGIDVIKSIAESDNNYRFSFTIVLGLFLHKIIRRGCRSLAQASGKGLIALEAKATLLILLP